MNYRDMYQSWLNSNVISDKDKEELIALSSDENELKERFYKDLEFGTAGLRGKMGLGTNRMNEYIIARATDAFAKVILEEGEEATKRGVVIAHDPRLFSKDFALITALVFVSNGIKTYLFEDLRPTPELSFAVRYLKCKAGVNITASHNPKDYNGYKAYWEEGSQIKDDIANRILAKIDEIDDFSKIKYFSERDKEAYKNNALESGLLEIIGKEVDDAYINSVKSLSLNDSNLDKSINIVYTPLNGAGNIPVQRVLSEKGFKNLYIVKEQQNPDGRFPTIEYPNPEDQKAFEYALNLAKEVNGEIVIATDPDCDRIAFNVLHNGKYELINGNQAGYLLVNYILSQMFEKNLIWDDALIVKSIVTSELGAIIAKKYNVDTKSVLTGFKNISGVQNELDKIGKGKMILGWEESIGYAVGTFVRDKDGVSATMLFVEIAAYYKKQGKTLIDALEDIYKEFGYHIDDTVSIVLEGIEGQERIKRMMSNYREFYPTDINGIRVEKFVDYKISKEFNLLTNEEKEVEVEKQNAIKFILQDGSWYAIRPSGTEPKIKIYMNGVANNFDEANKMLEIIKDVVINKLNSIQ